MDDDALFPGFEPPDPPAKPDPALSADRRRAWWPACPKYEVSED
jgi:hypothetical protein